MKILANDGISANGIAVLKENGIEVLTKTVAQEQLANFINKNEIVGLLVRSATKVDKSLIDACSGLKLIGRGGVGMDNIDVSYAEKQGLKVFNTPAASSESVAELVFAHLYGGVRYLYDTNRTMPLEGDSKFKQLKKAYAKGIELSGKTLGIIGLGRIGEATAKIALGVRMKVVYFDPEVEKANIKLAFYDGQEITFNLTNSTKQEVLQQADFLTLHVPAQQKYVMDKDDFQMMKDGVGVINASRGGVLDEVALVEALENGKVSFAGLDVFESEPKPEIRILMHPNISLSPHIGAATKEAQDRIGLELAQKVITALK